MICSRSVATPRYGNDAASVANRRCALPLGLRRCAYMQPDAKSAFAPPRLPALPCEPSELGGPSRFTHGKFNLGALAFDEIAWQEHGRH